MTLLCVLSYSLYSKPLLIISLRDSVAGKSSGSADLSKAFISLVIVAPIVEGFLDTASFEALASHAGVSRWVETRRVLSNKAWERPFTPATPPRGCRSKAETLNPPSHTLKGKA